jgi:hypothetical protein
MKKRRTLITNLVHYLNLEQCPKIFDRETLVVNIQTIKKLVISFEHTTLLPSTNPISLKIFNYIGEFDRGVICGGDMALREPRGQYY